MASTAETASGEMAVDDGEMAVEGATLPADEAELGVAFGGEAGAQAETIRKIPQIASSPR
jgi:dihydroxyacetone kinase